MSSLRERLAAARFQVELGTHWLVWEAGEWTPAQANQAGTAPNEGGAKSGRQVAADPLAFELKAGAGPARFVVGRARESDVLLDDATVSRSHLALEFNGKVWSVQLAPRARKAALDGAPVSPVARPLRSGGLLTLGGVSLTFFDGPGLMARLRKDSPKASKR